MICLYCNDTKRIFFSVSGGASHIGPCPACTTDRCHCGVRHVVSDATLSTVKNEVSLQSLTTVKNEVQNKKEQET